MQSAVPASALFRRSATSSYPLQLLDTRTVIVPKINQSCTEFILKNSWSCIYFVLLKKCYLESLQFLPMGKVQFLYGSCLSNFQVFISSIHSKSLQASPLKGGCRRGREESKWMRKTFKLYKSTLFQVLMKTVIFSPLLMAKYFSLFMIVSIPCPLCSFPLKVLPIFYSFKTLFAFLSKMVREKI